MAEHNNTLVNLRVDDYSFGGFEETAPQNAKFNYGQLNYDTLRDIYLGLETTGMQYGSLLARTIVDTLTAFEMGNLPTPVVYDASGAEDEEATQFAQTFLREQHSVLMEVVNTKNIFGDGYLVFNVDRNLESLPPNMVFPGWAPFSSQLESATVIQVKRLKSQNSSATAEMKVTRNYNAKQIKYTAEITDAVQGVVRPKSVTLVNPLGICPVVHLPNLRPAGYQFGVSDFYSSIPYFLLFHQTLMRGFESQQYGGRPILTITGIEGSVAQWLQMSFGIDVNAESEDSLSSKILDMFKKHKLLALSGNVQAQFIESKTPIGKTEEILRVCLAQIARLSTVPEFVFGAALETANASVREQYAALQGKIGLKQAAITPYLCHIIRMAMVWYSTVSKNEETGEPLETIGLVSTFADALKNYKIKLIWPEFLGAEKRTKIEALAMLAQAGAVSKKSLMNNYPELIPSPDAELTELETEAQAAQQLAVDTMTQQAEVQAKFAPDPTNVTQPQSTANAKERLRKNAASGGSGSNPHASATNQRSRSQGKK